ncbi:MAG TPA: vitamin K epoxide reductase family protein [Terriglobales bacterium]|nr:vitamin K epoxide reductase family protein [Terriglobales bacterium]
MQRLILIGLAIIGLVDSIYLAWIKMFLAGACSLSSGCEVVNTSSYSSIAGIPVALLGAGAYAMILVALLFENRSEFLNLNGPLIVFGLCLVGVLYSIYLTYLELYVIHAVCPFCVVSAVVLTLMLIVSSLRLRQTLSPA